MLRRLTFLIVTFSVSLSPVIGQQLTTTLPEKSALEELPVEDGKIDVKKLTKTLDTESSKILKRITEIDGIINKAYAEKAVEIYGLEIEEYDFLRRQSEVSSTPLVQFFRSGRRTDINEIEEANQYFTFAFDAISKNEFWYGREETLLEKDKEFYQSMKQKITTEFAKTDEGLKILNLEEEKGHLLSLLKAQKPLFEYLVERRKWWKIYPDYQELVERIEEEKNQAYAP